jgi:uncharacterized iron-regulated membrane protein
MLALAAMLGFLTAGFVVIAFITGTRLAALQDSELERYKKDADLRIADAHKESSKANEQAELAKAASDSSEVKQLEIERQNAQLQRQIEQEKHARREIEKQLAARHISVQQTAMIRKRLACSAPQ